MQNNRFSWLISYFKLLIISAFIFNIGILILKNIGSDCQGMGCLGIGPFLLLVFIVVVFFVLALNIFLFIRYKKKNGWDKVGKLLFIPYVIILILGIPSVVMTEGKDLFFIKSGYSFIQDKVFTEMKMNRYINLDNLDECYKYIESIDNPSHFRGNQLARKCLMETAVSQKNISLCDNVSSRFFSEDEKESIIANCRYAVLYSVADFENNPIAQSDDADYFCSKLKNIDTINKCFDLSTGRNHFTKNREEVLSMCLEIKDSISQKGCLEVFARPTMDKLLPFCDEVPNIKDKQDCITFFSKLVDSQK